MGVMATGTWLARTTGAGADSGSEASLADDRSTVAYIFDGSELVSKSASTVRAGDQWHGDARIIAEAQRENLIENSDDATIWDQNNATDRTDTLADWSGMKRVSVASQGASGGVNRASTTSSLGAGTTILLALYYEAGTSGRLRVILRNNTLGDNSIASGTIGSLTTLSHGAGTIDVVSDELVGAGPQRLAVVTVVADGAGVWYCGAGPNTSAFGDDVIVYGMDVFDATEYFATHVTTTTGSATYNADALHYANGGWMAGKDFVFVDQYRSDCIPADLVETLLDLDNGTTKLTANATNFEFTDGTNTATVAHSGIYAADTDVDVMVARIGTSMAVGIAPAGGSVTWSTTQTYSEPTYHSKLYIAPTQVAPHYIELAGIYDADEFATIGDAKTWVEGQVTAGWPGDASAVGVTIRPALRSNLSAATRESSVRRAGINPLLK